MLQKAINAFEELKKYVFIIDRGTKGCIVIKFTNGNFYHLVGFQYTNINMFIPDYIVSKTNKYKYIKNNINKFENILQSEIRENDRLKNRIYSFPNIFDLLMNNGSTLYNLNPKVKGSLYDGDYGLMKLYEELCCLLGLKIDYENDNVKNCAPQSWMANKESNNLISNKRPIYMKDIHSVPISLYNNDNY